MELVAQKRSVTGKGVQTMRKEGRMPAVVYGAKEEATSIEVSTKDFSKVFEEAGESDVVSLVIDGEAKNVLIYEVDFDPLTNAPRHADFYAIQKGQKIETEVPLVFVGEAPAVKELGANLIKVLRELEIEAEATNIPHEITVDVSGLTAIDQEIKAKDLVLPAGVTLVTKPAEIVAIIAEAEEEPEEPAPAPDMASIEISEERGKKPEEASEEGKSEGAKE